MIENDCSIERKCVGVERIGESRHHLDKLVHMLPLYDASVLRSIGADGKKRRADGLPDVFLPSMSEP